MSKGATRRVAGPRVLREVTEQGCAIDGAQDRGAVLERLEMPRGTAVSGMESDGADLFYCGGGATGKVRAVRRPKQEKS